MSIRAAGRADITPSARVPKQSNLSFFFKLKQYQGPLYWYILVWYLRAQYSNLPMICLNIYLKWIHNTKPLQVEYLVSRQHVRLTYHYVCQILARLVHTKAFNSECFVRSMTKPSASSCTHPSMSLRCLLMGRSRDTQDLFVFINRVGHVSSEMHAKHSYTQNLHWKHVTNSPWSKSRMLVKC